MSGVCPACPVTQTTDYNNPGTFSALMPDPRFNTCCGTTHENINDTDPVVTETCCTVPGPPGPGMNWMGCWDIGITYAVDDFISYLGTSYICTTGHVADIANSPDGFFDGCPGGVNWTLVGGGGSGGTLDPEDESFLGGLGDWFTWIKDIGNWGIGDYWDLLVGGVKLAGALAGAVSLFNMFFNDGDGDDDGNGAGEADSNFQGDPLTSGVDGDPSSGGFVETTLPEVVTSLCLHAQLTPAQIDVTLLPATKISFTIGQISTSRSILDMLSVIYQFSMVDTSGTLKFVPIAGQTVVKSLLEEYDLGWASGSGTDNLPPAPITAKRLQGIDLPREFNLTYTSEALAYNDFVQTATLETFPEGNIINTSVPITLTDQEAYDVAETSIMNAHVGRTTYAFTGTYDHIELEPGDIINVDTIGDLLILRVEEDQSVGLLNFICVNALFNVDTFTPSGVPTETPQQYIDAPKVIGYSGGLVLELPPLDASDREPRLTLAPHGYGKDGWPGCAIYVSRDGGNTYNLFSSTSAESTWGMVTLPVAQASHYTWDEVTTIDVELKSGTLESKPEINVLNGENWCLIANEIIGFKNAVFNGGTSYTLSGLLRGRRGTEIHIPDAQADSPFILLDSALVEFPYPRDQTNLTYNFKFVTIGSDIGKAQNFEAGPNILSRRPWAPYNVQKELIGTDWTVTWVGRNQFMSDMVDSQEIPKPEGFRGFGIQFLDGGGLVKRDTYQNGSTFTYTEAMQIEDFGSAQGSITVRVVQLDEIAGLGFNTQI